MSRISLDTVWTAWAAVVLACLLSLLNYALRAIRWSVYLSSLGYKLAPRYLLLSYVAGFAFTLSPGKLGEMIRARYYKHAGVPISATASAFVMERLMDLLAVLALALIALAVSADPMGLLSKVLILTALLVLVLTIVCLSRGTGLWKHPRMPRPINSALCRAQRAFQSSRALLQAGLLWSGFLIGILAWGAEGLGLMLIAAMAPAIPLDWASATAIYAVSILGGAISLLPGGLGSTEAVMVALLSIHGFPTSDAILLTLMCRLVTLWFAVGIGWVAVFLLGRYRFMSTRPQ